MRKQTSSKPSHPNEDQPKGDGVERKRGRRRFDEHVFERQHHEHDEHHHGKRNFWSDWRYERDHHGRGEHMPIGQALSPKEMEAWREYFQQTFGTWPEDHWIFGGRRFSPWHQGMDSFNPFVATLLSKGGGLLPLYLLHLISQQPQYGNAIMELLAQRTNGQWVSNPGAIYPLLTVLEKEGFIDGKWEDPDKRTVRIYTITEAGQAELARIETIVMPKLIETLQVLQDFIKDLQSGSATRTEAGDQADAEVKK
jgi:DNA-binding PadR family transcriptional regulator